MKNVPDPFAEIGGDDPKPAGRPYPVAAYADTQAPEGLLSWTVALARAHCVSPRSLVRHLVATSVTHRDRWNDTPFFERHCGTCNGLGAYAGLMTELLGSCEHVSTASMTLLPLAELLPFNGQGLLVRSPTWCPLCLCDQVRSGQRAHHPLLWSLEHYRICHVHNVALTDRCPACGLTQAFLPSYPSLLHCSHCGEPLLVLPPNGVDNVDRVVSDFDRWCATALRELIARRHELRSDGSLDHLRQNLHELTLRFSGGNRARFCVSVGLQPRALNGWLDKAERPSLEMLLRLGYPLQLNPARLYFPGATEIAIEPKLTPPAGERQKRPMLGYRERERIGALLAVILADETDHRPLASIAIQVGLSGRALKYWFRDLCVGIVQKNRNVETRRLELQYRSDHDLLRVIIQGMRATGTSLSRRRVDRELRKHQLSLMRPDLFGAFRKLTICMEQGIQQI